MVSEWMNDTNEFVFVPSYRDLSIALTVCHRKEWKEQPGCWAWLFHILAANSNAFTLCDPLTLTFWPNINWWAMYRDGLSCAEFGDFAFSCFGFIVWTDRITEANQRYTHVTTVDVSNNRLIIWASRAVMRWAFEHQHIVSTWMVYTS